MSSIGLSKGYRRSPTPAATVTRYRHTANMSSVPKLLRFLSPDPARLDWRVAVGRAAFCLRRHSGPRAGGAQIVHLVPALQPQSGHLGGQVASAMPQGSLAERTVERTKLNVGVERGWLKKASAKG